MNKIEMLFVRACKSKNPVPRLFSICRRFYLNNDIEDSISVIEYNLAKICDHNKLIGIQDYIQKEKEHENRKKMLSGFSEYDNGNDNKYSDRFMILLNVIRFAKVERLDGYISPVKFKDEEG